MAAVESSVETDLPATAAGTEPGHDRLRGRRVLVVGGGQRVFDAATDPVGNGRAISTLAAREGAQVVVADRDETSARQTVERIVEEGGTAHVITGDVTDPADAERLVHDAADLMGGLDGMSYNVGIGIVDLDLAGVKVDEWDRIFDANVRGAMLCAREALAQMGPNGSIVLTSSTAGLRSGSRLIAYESSKAALAGLMRSIAREGAELGVRANIVAPGLVDTPNGRTAGAGRPDRSASYIPLRRMATAWDIAYGVVFFLSTESSYITGQLLAVDGGRTGV